jgi:Ca-activated chloride channel family protein
LGAVLVCILLPQQQPAHAFSWDELWQTPDQQAQTALDNGELERATTLFQNPNWKGAAAYKNKDYATAAQQYAAQNSIDAQYNYGNALAKAGKFKEAIAAYQKVLAANPNHADAQNNLKVIEDALKKQDQQQGKGQNDPKQKPEQDPQKNQQDQQNQQQSQSGKDPQQQQQQGQQEQQKAAEDQKKQEAAQKAAEEQAKQQQEQQAQQGEKDNKEKQDKGKQGEQADKEDPQKREQEQATEQWLRRIPDDPSGLWRRKFQYQYQQRGAQTRGEEW